MASFFLWSLYLPFRPHITGIALRFRSLMFIHNLRLSKSELFLLNPQEAIGSIIQAFK